MKSKAADNQEVNSEHNRNHDEGTREQRSNQRSRGRNRRRANSRGSQVFKMITSMIRQGRAMAMHYWRTLRQYMKRYTASSSKRHSQRGERSQQEGSSTKCASGSNAHTLRKSSTGSGRHP